MVRKENKVAGAKLLKLRIAYNMTMKWFKFNIFVCSRDFLSELSAELIWKSKFKVAG